MAVGDRDLIERIKSSVDIVEIAQGYFALKQRGANFVALCPFHREKTPSFSINQRGQFFHCFGCGKSGDVFTLVMEMDRMSFPEAKQVLARRGGVPLDERRDPRDDERLKLYKLCQAAADYYVGCLADRGGARAREYLANRGIDAEVIERFGIGYAPDAWRSLISTLTGRGFDSADLVRCGLARESGDKPPYDLLRDRVIIPIRDTRGRVIAFGGRLLGPGEPKYINSPESDLFSKRRVLYGLERARDDAARRGHFVIVEGYMDVIAAHAHGVVHVVGSLGTSLTRDHAREMSRYAKRAILLFDADEAGRRAADRGAPILLQEGFDVSIAHLPAGQDPDDFLREHSAAEFTTYLGDHAEDLVTYLARRARERHPGDDVGAAAQAAREVLDQVGEVRDPIQADLLLTRVAQEFGLEERLVRREAGRARGPTPDRGGPPADVAATRSRRMLKGFEKDEVFVLHGALTDQNLAKRVAADLSPDDFRDSARRRVFQAIQELISNDHSAGISQALHSLCEDPAAVAAMEELLGKEIPAGDSAAQALERIMGRRSEQEYRRMRDEASRVFKSDSDEDELNRRLARFARFHADRIAGTKDMPRPDETGDNL